MESDLCWGNDSVDLKFTLKSEKLGSSTETLNIPISNEGKYELEDLAAAAAGKYAITTD